MKDEEMAEEYRKDLKSKFFLSEPQLDLACQGFKDGLRKANEWHYVKDGDLPKEYCIVYYKDSFGEPSLSVVHPSWYIAGVEAFFKNNPQIIAWKEIVLPKESE